MVDKQKEITEEDVQAVIKLVATEILREQREEILQRALARLKEKQTEE